VARFYPNALRAGAPASERRVFDGLKKLGDDWVVMHGLQFVTPAHGRHPPRNGEADFILAHRNHGLIVLEVKGGRYEVEHGRWFTFPDGKCTPMNRSSFAQAMRNRYDLRDYVVGRTGFHGIPLRARGGVYRRSPGWKPRPRGALCHHRRRDGDW